MLLLLINWLHFDCPWLVRCLIEVLPNPNSPHTKTQPNPESLIHSIGSNQPFGHPFGGAMLHWFLAMKETCRNARRKKNF